MAMLDDSKLGNIAVWWMDVGSSPAEMTTPWSVCLDAAERARAARFRFQEDRLTYIAAHWLLRTALASVTDRPAADWRFIVEKQGKPRIDPGDGVPELRFNLSHTRGFVACAICIGSEIGIDVETFATERANLDIAARHFSPSEVAILRSTTLDRQPVVFFRFWTLKEAFIKATGQGLSRALDSFSFSLDPVSITLPGGEANEAVQWQFVEVRPTARHFLALAIHRPPCAPGSLIICPVDPCRG
jgi:4'-phosphopantetheinyl transferase